MSNQRITHGQASLTVVICRQAIRTEIISELAMESACSEANIARPSGHRELMGQRLLPTYSEETDGRLGLKRLHACIM
jgi:hypothetical protein